MKPAKKKPQNEDHFNDELIKKPGKKQEVKRDRKPRIYEIDDEEELPDFDTLLDEEFGTDDEEDDF